MESIHAGRDEDSLSAALRVVDRRLDRRRIVLCAAGKIRGKDQR